MQCFWTVFVDANTRQKASAIASKLEELANTTFQEVEVLPYHKGGHEIRFWVEHDTAEWPLMVYEVMQMSQRMGYQWIIAGDIEEEFSLTSTKAKTPGVKMLSCWCSPAGKKIDC
jgi:hypothetical protein